MTCAAIGPVIKICLDGLVSHELAGDLEGRETIGIPDLVELVDEVERARNHVVGSRLAIHDIRAKLRTVLLDGLLLALCIRAGGVLVEKLDGSERLLVLGQLVVCGLGVLHGLLRRRNGSLGIGDSLVLLGLGCIGARERLGSGIDLGLRVDSCLLGIGERLACVVHDLLGGVLRRLRSVGGRLGRILRLLGVVEVGLDVGVGGLVKHLLSRVFLCLGVLYGLLGCGRLALCLIVGRLGVLLVCSIRGMLGSELVRVVVSGLLRRLGRVLLGVLGSGSVTGIGLRLLGIARLAGKGVDVGLRRSAGLGAIGSLLLRLGVGDGSLVVLDGLVCSILCCLGIIGRLLALAGRLVGSILAGLRLVQVRLGRVGSGLLAGKLLVRGIGCGSVAGGLLGVLCLRVCVGSGLLGVGCGRLVVSCGLGGIVRSLLGILRLLWRVVLNVSQALRDGVLLLLLRCLGIRDRLLGLLDLVLGVGHVLLGLGPLLRRSLGRGHLNGGGSSVAMPLAVVSSASAGVTPTDAASTPAVTATRAPLNARNEPLSSCCFMCLGVPCVRAMIALPTIQVAQVGGERALGRHQMSEEKLTVLMLGS